MNWTTRWLLLAWLTGVIAIVASGFVLDGYAEHVLGLRVPQPYPFQGVAQYAGLATLELLAVLAIVRPGSYRSSWTRAAMALALASALAVLHAMTLMHPTTYQLWHEVWLFGVCLGLAMSAIVSGLSRVRTLRRVGVPGGERM